MWPRYSAGGRRAGGMRPACKPHATRPIHPMHPRLQPYASQAATLCIPGELDDSRLVEAAAGERFVFKRRGTETEAPRGEQESYLVIPLRRRYGGGSRRGHREQWRRAY